MKFVKLAVFAAILWSPFLLRAANLPPVTVATDDASFTLDNGIVSAQVARRSGDLLSLKYHQLELLDTHGRQAGYWSHDAARGRPESRTTIDPLANGGDRAEVSVKGVANGTPLGSGPGGGVYADVEIRYALGRGDSGVYTYTIFTHPTNYPATSVGEARFCLKLNDDLFDWMSVDANRNMEMITTYDWNHGTQMNFKEARRINTGRYQGLVEHKYDYSANQFTVRAWGWSSSTRQVGIWFVNPSVEYLSGGPTKFELSSHRDATFNTSATNAPAPPTLLNYWRSSHYGGSICNLAATDAWTKVIGPFLIYCNSAKDHDALWHDALAKAGTEASAWPFDWVNGVDYPHQAQRATVTGKIVLDDPQAPGVKLKHLLVGLTAPAYAPASIPRAGRGAGRFPGFGLTGGGDDEAALTNLNNLNNSAAGSNDFTGRFARANANEPATNRFGRFDRSDRSGTNGFRGRSGGGGGFNGIPRIVDWQIDAKNYQFWVAADDSGDFKIPNVRPGTYSLHAIADGVLGDLTLSNITVAPAQKLALGRVDWQPVRFGRQLWDIGIPNRSGSEFFKGDDYFHWGWYLQYPGLFPYDVKYVIGKSDFRKDWFFEQVPHNEDTNNNTGRGNGSATTWTVTFDLPEAPHGRATLRLAICGVGTRTLLASVNDQPIGNLTNLVYNATINRDGIGGYWSEHDLTFNAALMKQGPNVLALTVPAGPLMNGIIYDYLRLELDENAKP